MTRKDRVKALLADEKFSYRAIAREVGCSDWTVRQIARERNREWHPMKSTHDQTADVASWVGVAVTVAAIGVAVWVRLRSFPPIEISDRSF